MRRRFCRSTLIGAGGQAGCSCGGASSQAAKAAQARQGAACAQGEAGAEAQRSEAQDSRPCAARSSDPGNQWFSVDRPQAQALSRRSQAAPVVIRPVLHLLLDCSFVYATLALLLRFSCALCSCSRVHAPRANVQAFRSESRRRELDEGASSGHSDVLTRPGQVLSPALDPQQAARADAAARRTLCASTRACDHDRRQRRNVHVAGRSADSAGRDLAAEGRYCARQVVRPRVSSAPR